MHVANERSRPLLYWQMLGLNHRRSAPNVLFGLSVCVSLALLVSFITARGQAFMVGAKLMCRGH